jgi:hypothetical protein
MKRSRIYDEEAHSGALRRRWFREVPAGCLTTRSGRLESCVRSRVLSKGPSVKKGPHDLKAFATSWFTLKK